MRRYLASLLTLSIFAGAGPTQYVFTTIDAPGPVPFTQLHGVNNRGEMVGIHAGAGGDDQGFLLSGGSLTPLMVAGARGTDARKVNDAGQVVGYATMGLRGPTNGFLYEGGNYTTLMVPGAFATLCNGINNRGEIVGDFGGAVGPLSGFLLSGGTYTSLPLPNRNVEVHAINDAGDVVGSFLSGDSEAFLLRGAGLTTFTVPASRGTSAFGINNLGMIVGTYADAASLQHGYLFSNGSYTTLDVPGAAESYAYGINDAGDIVGYYRDARGVEHGFLASPVPEPSGLVLLGMGVLSLASFAWRRQARVA